MRELLQLVLQNAMSSKEVQLASLYDKIESYLQALDTLGVTTDKCAAMLFALVESSLPEEFFRVWQRSNSAVRRIYQVMHRKCLVHQIFRRMCPKCV